MQPICKLCEFGSWNRNWLLWKTLHCVFCVYKPRLVLLQIMVSIVDQLVKLLGALLILLPYYTIRYHLSSLLFKMESVVSSTHSILIPENLSKFMGIDHSEPLCWGLSFVWKLLVLVGNNDKIVPHWTHSSNCHCLKKAAL